MSDFQSAQKAMYEAGLIVQQKQRDRISFLENELRRINEIAERYRVATPIEFENSASSASTPIKVQWLIPADVDIVREKK